MEDLRRAFKPEFLNRIDEIIVFHQLTKDNIRDIARNMLTTVKGRLAKMDIDLEADESAVDYLAEHGFDPVYGARPLRRLIQSTLEDKAAEKILDNEIKAGDKVIAFAENDKLDLKEAETASVGS